MTGPRDPRALQEFLLAAGGEEISEVSATGVSFALTGLPMPTGTVRVVLSVFVPEAGRPFGVLVEVTADQARRMGELLTRVASR